MTITEIVLIVIAIGFIALVVYLIRLLCSVTHLVKTISNDLAYKSKSLNPLFNALSIVGEAVEEKSINFKKKYTAFCNNLCEEESDKVSDLIGWALHGFNIYKKFKKGD